MNPLRYGIAMEPTGFWGDETTSTAPAGEQLVQNQVGTWVPLPGTNLAFQLTGTEAATPLPAALPLFATGLGAMGFFGWRRKRKAQAIAT